MIRPLTPRERAMQEALANGRNWPAPATTVCIVKAGHVIGCNEPEDLVYWLGWPLKAAERLFERRRRHEEPLCFVYPGPPVLPKD